MLLQNRPVVNDLKLSGCVAWKWSYSFHISVSVHRINRIFALAWLTIHKQQASSVSTRVAGTGAGRRAGGAALGVNETPARARLPNKFIN